MTNSERVGRGLDGFRKALLPIVEGRLLREYGDRWQTQVRAILPQRHNSGDEIHLDLSALIGLCLAEQHRKIWPEITPRERSWLHEIRDARNRVAHQVNITEREVDRVVGTIELFVRAIQPKNVVATGGHTVPLPDDNGIRRGQKLFRFLAHRANAGDPVGISYAGFVAYVFGKASFRDAADRNYLPSDSGRVIEIAMLVTSANGGRLQVTKGSRSIATGMDTDIWNRETPFVRPDGAWQNPNYTLPYSRQDWLAVFPDGVRRLISAGELGALA
jgi:hypothetical protein